MSKKTVQLIKAPSAEVIYAAAMFMGQMSGWRQSLKPLMDGAAAHLRDKGTIVPDLPRALDEFGRYCRTLGREIKAAQAERARATIAPVSPPGPEPVSEAPKQVSARRAGETSSSSAPRPVGRPRKPVLRE